MPWNIIRLGTVTSTMDEAAGHPPGTVVVAEEQTAGRGRLERRWHSAPGAGLYFSAVLEHPEPAPIVTLALGLAVQEAIQQTAGVDCDIRWPNDLLIGERKCAGILVQYHGGRLIAGIGVNVNHEGMPPELAGIATSLRMVTGRERSKEQLLAAVLGAIEVCLHLTTGEVLRLFAQASSYASGRRVTVESAELSLAGTTDGLDPSGFLWIRDSDGRRHLLHSGGVRAADSRRPPGRE